MNTFPLRPAHGYALILLGVAGLAGIGSVPWSDFFLLLIVGGGLLLVDCPKNVDTLVEHEGSKEQKKGSDSNA